MEGRLLFAGAAMLVVLAPGVYAGEEPHYRARAAAECPQDAVDAHVREQIALYGPRSKDREHFGFIYVLNGEIRSAVIRGHACAGADACSVDTADAAPLIPRGAKVLGEWHTHPQTGKASLLSPDDVRGARSNRHIRCYSAYYSQPDGDVYAWNPFQSSVPTAMHSAVFIDNYRRAARGDVRVAQVIARRPPADSPAEEQDENPAGP
jgi:hypothetical protein